MVRSLDMSHFAQKFQIDPREDSLIIKAGKVTTHTLVVLLDTAIKTAAIFVRLAFATLSLPLAMSEKGQTWRNEYASFSIAWGDVKSAKAALFSIASIYKTQPEEIELTTLNNRAASVPNISTSGETSSIDSPKAASAPLQSTKRAAQVDVQISNEDEIINAFLTKNTSTENKTTTEKEDQNQRQANLDATSATKVDSGPNNQMALRAALANRQVTPSKNSDAQSGPTNISAAPAQLKETKIPDAPPMPMQNAEQLQLIRNVTPSRKALLAEICQKNIKLVPPQSKDKENQSSSTSFLGDFLKINISNRRLAIAGRSSEDSDVGVDEWDQ